MTSLTIETYGRLFDLTTDHPASSYGQPVLVDADGRVYGPSDVVCYSDYDEPVAANDPWQITDRRTTDAANFVFSYTHATRLSVADYAYLLKFACFGDPEMAERQLRYRREVNHDSNL